MCESNTNLYCKKCRMDTKLRCFWQRRQSLINWLRKRWVAEAWTNVTIERQSDWPSNCKNSKVKNPVNRGGLGVARLDNFASKSSNWTNNSWLHYKYVVSTSPRGLTADRHVGGPTFSPIQMCPSHQGVPLDLEIKASQWMGTMYRHSPNTCSCKASRGFFSYDVLLPFPGSPWW